MYGPAPKSAAMYCTRLAFGFQAHPESPSKLSNFSLLCTPLSLMLPRREPTELQGVALRIARLAIGVSPNQQCPANPYTNRTVRADRRMLHSRRSMRRRQASSGKGRSAERSFDMSWSFSLDERSRKKHGRSRRCTEFAVPARKRRSGQSRSQSRTPIESPRSGGEWMHPRLPMICLLTHLARN